MAATSSKRPLQNYVHAFRARPGRTDRSKVLLETVGKAKQMKREYSQISRTNTNMFFRHHGVRFRKLYEQKKINAINVRERSTNVHPCPRKNAVFDLGCPHVPEEMSARRTNMAGQFVANEPTQKQYFNLYIYTYFFNSNQKNGTWTASCFSKINLQQIMPKDSMKNSFLNACRR